MTAAVLDRLRKGKHLDLADASEGQNPPGSGWKVSVVNENLVSAYDFVVGVMCSR